jgi:hypothetical protein
MAEDINFPEFDDSFVPGEDEESQQEDVASPEDDRKRRIRLVILGLFILVLICLIGALLYQIFFPGDGDGGPVDTPTPTFTPTPEGPDVVITPEMPTQTPTLVVIEEPSPEPTEEPMATPEPTEEPEPTSTLTTEPLPDDLGPVVLPGAIENQLKNGDFEEGFDANGVGLEWTDFRNDRVIVVFSPESPGPFVKSGDTAQRITMAEATEPDRYAGIYQQIDIVPGETYTLTLYGQIRTGFGDVDLSSYGYRVQYAIDQTGGTNWQDVAAENWVELPWDEQLLHSPDVEFVEYTTNMTSTSDQITLFVRVWNKWADPGEVQYTLDNLSLMGPSSIEDDSDGDETLIDQPLPTTGAGDSSSLIRNSRFWGAVLVLLLLAAGAIYRAKWSH